jgi:valyl-tRNA synthetase
MGRINKKTEGVFTDIIGGTNKTSKPIQFVNQGGNSPELLSFIDDYKKIIDKSSKTIENLAKIEEIILQLRTRENPNNIKLCLVRDYIYARIPFFRFNHKSKDIRIIVDKIQKYPKASNDLNSLLKNKTFMSSAKNKLIDAMNNEIIKNIAQYNSTK